MEHLSLEIFDLTGDGSKYAALESDASITITETSEIFAEGDVWSYSFRLNIPANAHIFGSAGDIHGTKLHDQIHKLKARLWVEGIPLFTGYLILGDEADVDENGDIDVSFESGQKTFKTMIEGAKANQVPLMNDVRFGMALWQKRFVPLSMVLDAVVSFSNGKTAGVKIQQQHEGVWGEYVYQGVEGERNDTPTQEYPRMVYPKGQFCKWNQGKGKWMDYEDINDLNTDHPYTEDEDGTPTYPFCNVALCYQKYDYMKKNEKGETYYDYSAEPEAQRGYEVMPANRVNSAPNFYVLYWLRCLMTHLGIHIDENQMLEVEDLRRLFMVNTKCAFKIRKNDEYIRTHKLKEGVYKFVDEGAARPRLHRRLAELIGPIFENGQIVNYQGCRNMVDPEKSRLEVNGYTPGTPNPITKYNPEITNVEIIGVNGTAWDIATKEYYESENNYLYEAFATKECFPNVNISDIIDALEKGFGMRLLFDGDYRRVRIILLRNVFRSDEVQELDCEVTEEEKIENNIRGFRMTYGDSTDTAFYYKGFADKLPHKKPYFIDDSDTHDYSQWDTNADYSDVVNKVSAFNKTCYVTPETGNSYVVKVDKDAKRYTDLHPSLFETAGFMDAENGDCSGDEETIETIDVGFTPAIMNDLNMDAEKLGATDQRFALFVDEKMRVRRHDLVGSEGKSNDADYYYNVDELYGKNADGDDIYQGMRSGDGFIQPGLFSIKSDIHTTISSLKAEAVIPVHIPSEHGGYSVNVTYPINQIELEGYVNAGYYLYLADNFEPNDDGVSPIETHDWGLTFGIMRGSGSDATVNYEPDYDDGEGNDTWEVKPGSTVTSHPDTCDSYGNMWDYDGQHKIEGVASAVSELYAQFPDSNAQFNTIDGYITAVQCKYLKDNTGKTHCVMFAKARGWQKIIADGAFNEYVRSLEGKSVSDMLTADAADKNLIIEIDSNNNRYNTLKQLEDMAYGSRTAPIYIDNGVGSTDGRFSLKLREKKPNPYFNEKEPEGPNNKRYLTVSDQNLRGRGLIDQFYKEYSKWLIDGRIIRRTVPMTFAQLSTLDKTKKVRIGDITGYVRKLQYSVNKQTGLGLVTMEILYI